MSTLLTWIFDGIGTELVSLIIGAFTGGIVGYKIGIRNRIKQKQTAANNSKQQQTITIDASNLSKDLSKHDSKIGQAQKAGDCAVQTQIGDIHHG